MTHCARGLYILLTFLYFSLFLSSVSYLSLSGSPITQPSEPTLRYLHLPAAFNSEQGTATTRCVALPLFLLSASSLFRCIRPVWWGETPGVGCLPVSHHLRSHLDHIAGFFFSFSFQLSSCKTDFLFLFYFLYSLLCIVCFRFRFGAFRSIL